MLEQNPSRTISRKTSTPKTLEQLSNSLGQKVPIYHQIADVLRDLIISGQLSPGERIVESKIARQLGVGQPTVRVALVILEHQGLIVRKANQGCLVTTLTPKEVAQIISVRMELEPFAVGLAAQNINNTELKEMAKAVEAMKAAADADDLSHFHSNDLVFHQTLWKAARNPFVEKLLVQLVLPLLSLYFLKTLRGRGTKTLASAAVGHGAVLDAIRSRDANLAQEAARENFGVFGSRHIRYFETEDGNP